MFDYEEQCEILAQRLSDKIVASLNEAQLRSQVWDALFGEMLGKSLQDLRMLEEDWFPGDPVMFG